MASKNQSIASATGNKGPGWNELGFVPWSSFRRMAPSILQLEVSRIASLIAASESIEFRNALVKSRFELVSFIEDLESGTTPDELETLHLQSAILNLPLDDAAIDEETGRTLAYILDRLQYVYNRIRFVYQ